jgi:tetratricopeptide (TPR) repeat protein
MGVVTPDGTTAANGRNRGVSVKPASGTVARMKGAAITVGLLAGVIAAPRARACGWDSESYHAEAKSLPCVYNAVTGTYPRHTPSYFETRAVAADAALAWAPDYAPALDDKGLALMKMGRLDEARAVMERRARLAPDAYAAHANLGTLYTFTGDYDLALAEIDRAMKIEPAAHFGRENYHRKLVEYLRALRDPAGAAKVLERDFLGLAVTKEQRAAGSPAALAAAGVTPDAFDALVSMITVYGADRVSHVHFALGDLLALRGDHRLAWTAYENARALSHPRSKELRRWQTELEDAIVRERLREPHPPESLSNGKYRGMPRALGGAHAVAGMLNTNYETWELSQLRHGLPVWRAEGLNVIYAKQHELRRRCESPGVIDARPAVAPERASATAAITKPGEGDAYLTALEAAAALPRPPAVTCAARAAAEAAFRTTHAKDLAVAPGLLQSIDADPARRARLTRALDTLVDAAMACRRPKRR